MKTKFFLLVLGLVALKESFAQRAKVSYQASVQTGLLEGEKGSAFQLQTVQGIQYKTWAAGVGAGLDYYQTRSVPLFLDLRKSFGQKDKGAFVYVDGGYNLPWLTPADKGFNNSADGGLYGAAGVGYQFAFSKAQQLFFDLGFSQKRFSITYNTMPYLSVWPPPAFAYEKYAYTLNRLSLRAGLRF